MFSILLANHASGFILAHNHPSGLYLPSELDIKAAHEIHLRARMLDLFFVDDIIISKLTVDEESEDLGYYSLKENGLLYI